jgi:hypothetical protein
MHICSLSIFNSLALLRIYSIISEISSGRLYRQVKLIAITPETANNYPHDSNTALNLGFNFKDEPHPPLIKKTTGHVVLLFRLDG